MTSLTLVRRIKARPSIVFDALTTVEGIANWWGRGVQPWVANHVPNGSGNVPGIRGR